MRMDLQNQFFEGFRDIVDSYQWIKSYPDREDFKKHLSEAIDKFDEYILITLESRLMQEIEHNLLLYSDKESKKAYLYSLITKFTGWSNLLHPNIDNCSIEEERKRVLANSDCVWSTLRSACFEAPANKGLDTCRFLASQFSNRFDVLCLKHGFDLFEMQEDCKVTIMGKRRDFPMVAEYFGSPELASKYIRAIEQTKAKTVIEKEQIPQLKITPALTNDERKRLFDSVKTYLFVGDTDEDSFNWAFGGEHCPENFQPIEIKAKSGIAILIRLLNGELSNENKRLATYIFKRGGSPIKELSTPKKDECVTQNARKLKKDIEKIRPPKTA